MKAKAIDMARNNATCVALIALICIGSLFMLANPLNIGAYDPPVLRGGVTHVVLFQFKETGAADAIADVS